MPAPLLRERVPGVRDRCYRNGFLAVMGALFAHYSYQFLVVGTAQWAITTSFFVGLTAFYGSLFVYEHGPGG